MPLRRKKVTWQTLASEGGVAIIARRMNGMGYPWHDRRVDHGIDGEIRLVSPGTRRTLVPAPDGGGRELAATIP